MNVDEIVKVFEKLGIKVEIDNEGKMKFFDKDIDEEMEVFYTQNPLLPLCNEDIKSVVSVAELAKKGGFISAKSSMKCVKFSLKKPRNNGGVDKNVIVMDYVDYNITSETDGANYIIQLDALPGSEKIQIDSYLNSNGSKHTSVTIFNEGYVAFELDERYGVFDTVFDESYQLSSSEMIDIIKSNELISTFANYYGKLYPGIALVINTISQNKEFKLSHKKDD